MSMRGKFLLAALMVFVLDHLTKAFVSASPSLHRGIDIIPGYFRLSYVLNSGVAFGIFQESQSAWKPYLLAGLAVLAVVVIAIYSSRMPSNRILLQMALALTTGGILGNFTDRLLRGSVVDFIELHIKDSFHWPTFNIADSAITIGIALLMVDALKHPDRRVSPGKADSLQ
jgi:signal peptidase II